MTREEFKALVEKGTVLLDGATGSNLMKAGMPKGVCTEKWICEHPEILKSLQKSYKEAGSQIVYAPTFSANRISLSGHGLEGQIEELNTRLVQISREAVGEDCLIAGDITTVGKVGEDYEVLVDVYKEQIGILAEAGVDLIVAETMLGVEETLAALDACRAVCDLPMMCSVTIESDGSLFFGGTVFDAVTSLEEMGADAVGLNCSVGPDQLEAVVRGIRERVSIPVLVKPNAGMPTITETGEAVYSMMPEDYGVSVKKLVEAGADIVGGCCGTTPEHIKATAKEIR